MGLESSGFSQERTSKADSNGDDDATTPEKGGAEHSVELADAP